MLLRVHLWQSSDSPGKNNVNVTLRIATKEDSEFAYQTKRSAFRDYVEQIRDWDEEEQAAVHKRRFASQDFRIIEVDGEDVGFLATQALEDHLHVYQIMILPEHQGCGIGRKCMVTIIEEARQLDLPVELQALIVNPRAIAFYLRLGFKETDRSKTHVHMRREPHAE